jgi:hypothetical protein
MKLVFSIQNAYLASQDKGNMNVLQRRTKEMHITFGEKSQYESGAKFSVFQTALTLC